MAKCKPCHKPHWTLEAYLSPTENNSLAIKGLTKKAYSMANAVRVSRFNQENINLIMHMK